MKKKKINTKGRQYTTLADALYNLDPASGTTDISYCRGMVVGLAAGIISRGGISFDDTAEILLQYTPKNFNIERIPECWQHYWMPMYLRKED